MSISLTPASIVSQRQHICSSSSQSLLSTQTGDVKRVKGECLPPEESVWYLFNVGDEQKKIQRTYSGLGNYVIFLLQAVIEVCLHFVRLHFLLILSVLHFSWTEAFDLYELVLMQCNRGKLFLMQGFLGYNFEIVIRLSILCLARKWISEIATLGASRLILLKLSAKPEPVSQYKKD
ncbi:unnamed protein product [Vicia faba]|uniref:Uncharacterized protein n=1 Tax=Vicia faba TaxID=3906 RepID=A0AAV1AKL7_VICFA|nr:unnamed protein product [Vicia faba]